MFISISSFVNSPFHSPLFLLTKKKKKATLTSSSSRFTPHHHNFPSYASKSPSTTTCTYMALQAPAPAPAQRCIPRQHICVQKSIHAHVHLHCIDSFMRKKKKKGRGSLDISPTDSLLLLPVRLLSMHSCPNPQFQFRQVIGRSPKSLEPLPPSCRHILVVTVVGSSGITLCIFLTCLPHIAHFFASLHRLLHLASHYMTLHVHSVRQQQQQQQQIPTCIFLSQPPILNCKEKKHRRMM